MIVELEKATKIFFVSKWQFKALENIDLTVEMGEKVCIFGPSGAGKSTLLHIIGLMEKLSSGKLRIFGEDVDFLSEKQKSKLRSEKIGFLFQSHHLLEDFTVLENMKIPLMVNNRACHDFLNELIEVLGIKEILHKFPSQISVGESQRVALARALVNNPELILADEPTGNLDAENSEIIWKLLLDISNSRKITLIYATHNSELKKYADRIINLNFGKIWNHSV